MSLNAKAIRSKLAKYTFLGETHWDKLVFALFGLIAPSKDRSTHAKWKLFASFVPKLWLKPKALHGLRVLIDPTDWSQTLIFEELFLHNNYDLKQVRFTPDTVLDCGAHIGLFSLMAASAFPNASIIAFEPNPFNASQVRQQVVANKIQVTVNESAVSVDNAERSFVIVNSHSGRLVTGDSAAAHRVRTTNLPAFLSEKKPQKLLLKMDVEGEEKVLFPALAPLLPRDCAIFFETHDGEAGWNDAQSLLASFGFQVTRVNGRGEFADGFALRAGGN